MLKTVEFLKDQIANGKSVLEAYTQLESNYGIKVKHYDSGITMLNYDQIDSPKTNPIVIECRSLILYTNSLQVASKKFDRFFNYGEAPDTLIGFDFKRSVALEKADGSLIGIWYDLTDHSWKISTRGLAYAEGEFITGGTFATKALEAFKMSSMSELNEMFNKVGSQLVTYIFELIGPENRIVTPYHEAQMVLIGAYNIETNEEFNWHHLKDVTFTTFKDQGMRGIRLPKVYDSQSSLEDVAQAANKLSDLQEGFVVWDDVSGKRVKVKSGVYLKAHRLRGENTVPTTKNMYELVLENEQDEFLAYFPEFTERVCGIKSIVTDFLLQADSLYESVAHIKSQKDFAIIIQNEKCKSLLFLSRKLSVIPSKAFNTLDLQKKMKIFLN